MRTRTDQFIPFLDTHDMLVIFFPRLSERVGVDQSFGESATMSTRFVCLVYGCGMPLSLFDELADRPHPTHLRAGATCAL